MCSLVETDRRFRDVIARIMEAVITPETSINFYQTTRRNKPEDSHLQAASYLVYIFMNKNFSGGNT
jgi:hypothetical protein